MCVSLMSNEVNQAKITTINREPCTVTSARHHSTTIMINNKDNNSNIFKEPPMTLSGKIPENVSLGYPRSTFIHFHFHFQCHFSLFNHGSPVNLLRMLCRGQCKKLHNQRSKTYFTVILREITEIKIFLTEIIQVQ